jgi:hypothetical protein
MISITSSLERRVASMKHGLLKVSCGSRRAIQLGRVKIRLLLLTGPPLPRGR